VKKHLNLIFAIIVTTVFILPVMWLYQVSFKSRLDIFSIPPRFFANPTLDNYYQAFVVNDFYSPFFNSVIICSVSTIFSLFISIFAAYSFSRGKTKVKSDLFFFYFSILIMPPVIIVLPLFLIFSEISLVGTYFSIIIVYIGMLIPFGTLLLKSYFDKISFRNEEIAIMDNLKFRQYFFKVFLYEAKMPIIITGFFLFLLSWNEFLFSMILTSKETITLPVSVLGLITPIGTFWGQIAAVSVISTIPIIVLSIIFRKHILSGFSFGIISNE